MEREENVCVEFVQPSGAEAQKEEEKSGLGKFKDVDALLKAYGCLQAEFTRRSQRLKELEREEENRKAAQKAGAGAKGVEKLRENAKVRKADETAFDEFVREIELADGAEDGAVSNANAVTAAVTVAVAENRPSLEAKAESAENGEEKRKEETGEQAAIGAEESKESSAKRAVFERTENGSSIASSRESVEIPSPTLYELVSRDEGVRLRIIGEYLASLQKRGAPLTAGGAGAPVTPPMKARTIDEAGTMALRWFKK